MILKLEDILDFSFLSIAFVLSMFIGEIHASLNFITFNVVSDILSVAMVLLLLII